MHLPIHCPKNLHNIPQSSQDPSKATINMVGVIPSRIKDEMVVLVQGVTHAQAKDQPKIIMEEIEQAPTKKRKQKSWRERQAKMAAKKQKEEEKKQ